MPLSPLTPQCSPTPIRPDTPLLISPFHICPCPPAHVLAIANLSCCPHFSNLSHCHNCRPFTPVTPPQLLQLQSFHASHTCHCCSPLMLFKLVTQMISTFMNYEYLLSYNLYQVRVDAQPGSATTCTTPACLISQDQLGPAPETKLQVHFRFSGSATVWT